MTLGLILALYAACAVCRAIIFSKRDVKPIWAFVPGVNKYKLGKLSGCKKLAKLNKYYKKKRAYNIIEIRFINYMKSNLYIRIDYYPKDLIYKLTWLDLNYGDVDNITKFVSTEVMNRE